MLTTRQAVAAALLCVACASVACPAVATKAPAPEPLTLEGQTLSLLFRSFVEKHKRPYTGNATELLRRRQHFARNVAAAMAQSAAPEQAAEGHTARFGVTKFSDYSPEELAALTGTRPPPQTQLLGGSQRSASCSGSPVDCSLKDAGNTPSSFDWRDDKRSVIKDVLDQGQCGSCWAFGSVETAESAFVIAGNEFGGQASVQQLLSCDTNSQAGCSGGDIEFAMEYLVALSSKGGGLEDSKEAPYACKSGCKHLPACPSEIRGPLVTINSTCSCKRWDEKSMRAYIANYGPLTIKVDADQWNGYISGIMRYHCSSLESSGDHAVQLVGYGEDQVYGETVPYWTVRNSWGSDFGEDGYIRLYRGDNVCGVANDVNMAFSSPPPSPKA